MEFGKPAKFNFGIAEMVGQFQAKPKMFFGEDIDIQKVAYYLQGYGTCLVQTGNASEFDEKFHFGFSEWLFTKYKSELPHQTNWLEIISRLHPTEPERINAFYREFEEFLVAG